MTASRARYRIAATALFGYCAVFVLLSADLLLRVWSLRTTFPQPNDVRDIFLLECTHSLVTTAAVLLGLATTRRVPRPELRPLVFALGFATVAFTKSTAFLKFPGFAQEQAANWLIGHHVPRSLLTFVFGSPAWAAWLALGALLVFAAGFPHTITAEQIRLSGLRDRPGILRGAGPAGADVGSLFRQLAAWLQQRDWLRARPIAGAALTLALLHHVLRRSSPASIGGMAVAALLVGLILTLLRAGYSAADDVARNTLRRLLLGSLAGSGLFLLSALTGLWPTTALLSAVLLSLAPAAVLAGVAGGVLFDRWPAHPVVLHPDALR